MVDVKDVDFYERETMRRTNSGLEKARLPLADEATESVLIRREKYR